MLPPSSLICRVTTASPIHTIEKTPEKTRLFCFSCALMDKNKLRRRQKIIGPLREAVSVLWEFIVCPRLTRDPNPSILRSSLPEARRLHLAIVLPYSECRLRTRHPHLSPQLRSHRLSAACPQADTWAIELVSSSPIWREGP